MQNQQYGQWQNQQYGQQQNQQYGQQQYGQQQGRPQSFLQKNKMMIIVAVFVVIIVVVITVVFWPKPVVAPVSGEKLVVAVPLGSSSAPTGSSSAPKVEIVPITNIVSCAPNQEKIGGVCLAKCADGSYRRGTICKVPVNTVAFPRCLEKMNWLRYNWNDPNYRDAFVVKGKVDGTDASFYRYLSTPPEGVSFCE